jgi:predicted double-glycine peptidase
VERLGHRRGLGPGAQGLTLRVDVVAQRNAYECGPASLAAVTGASIDELARLARTTEHGTEHAGMIAAARAVGAVVMARANGTIAELAAHVAAGTPVIVGWWSRGPGDRHWNPTWTIAQRRRRDRGHYSVIHGVTPAVITMMDPEAGTRDMPTAAFLRHWYDTDTPRYVKIRRWYLVVGPAPELPRGYPTPT